MKDKTIEELMERREAIATEIDLPEADLDALMEEARAINEELERRKAEAEKRSNIRAAVAKKDGEKIVEKEKKMTIDEIRSSKEYVNAYANYIKTEDDRECRALLTDLALDDESNPVTNGLPVPTIVDSFIRTAWEKNEVLRRVRKTYVRGVLHVGFELSATQAVPHMEGGGAPDEEDLQIGTVALVPQSIKKWIAISDEAMDMGGEEFLRYIIDEITYQIAKRAQLELLKAILRAPEDPTETAVSVHRFTVTDAQTLSAVAIALGSLSAEATDPVLVMTRQEWARFKAAAATANYAYDPFEGLPVVFVDRLPASTSQTVRFILGDFARGALMNFPNGEEIKVKRDDLSLSEQDLVKFVGRMYVGMGIVADKMFVVAMSETSGGGVGGVAHDQP